MQLLFQYRGSMLDIPPDESQSSFREPFELLGWVVAAPRPFAFVVVDWEATL